MLVTSNKADIFVGLVVCYSNSCDKHSKRLESVCILLWALNGRTKEPGLCLRSLTVQASNWHGFEQVDEESSGEEKAEKWCFWTFAGLSMPYVQTCDRGNIVWCRI